MAALTFLHEIEATSDIFSDSDAKLPFASQSIFFPRHFEQSLISNSIEKRTTESETKRQEYNGATVVTLFAPKSGQKPLEGFLRTTK